MRTLPLLAFALALSIPAVADHGVHGPDGVTARLVVTGWPAAASDAPVDVTVEIFRAQADGSWAQVQLSSTLRVFAHDGSAERLTHTRSFTSSATAPVVLTVPAGAFPAGEFADVFVTFSALGGDPVPTSHHNPARNALLDAGAFDVADGMDYHANARTLGT